MKFGQRYEGKGHISQYADYVQLNICGLSAIEIVQKYFLYEINKPIVLLGDYTSESRNAREDDMLNAERIYEIKDAITSLKAFGADLWAITLHPVTKKGLNKFGINDVKFKDFIDKLIEIYEIQVLVKNRQYDSLHLSNPEEIIEFSKTNKMTLDIVSLFESCGYDSDFFLDTLSKINLDNVQEVHIRGLSMSNKGLVANRDLDDSDTLVIDTIKLLKKIPWATFSSAGGAVNTKFDSIVKNVIDMIENDRE